MTPPEERRYPFIPDGVSVRTVSEVTDEVRQLLEQGFAATWVEGEISNLARPSSGHLYFSLRDSKATLKSVMYRTQALRLSSGFDPKDGDEVVALGRVSVYAPRGDYQFMVDRMFPKGIGAAELALRKLKERLQLDGYFDPRRKKPLLPFPRSLVLIASATGAAVRDMLEILRRRWPATRVAVRPSRVQGEGAAAEIAAAIEQVNRWRAQRRVQVDAIIIGRGGGSTEDLAPFNEEVVAHAIFQSRIPVISAVGHEIDVTIADLVADVRAATPSHAAELVVPDRRVIRDLIDKYGDRITDAIRRQVAQLKRRVDDLGQRRGLKRPVDRIRELERRLDEQGERLRRAAAIELDQRQRDLTALTARLEALSPLAVLARGYCLSRLESGNELLRSVDHVRPGDRLITELERGRIISRVESTDAALDRERGRS